MQEENAILPKKMEQVRGIEPPCSAWEADILPLNYTRKFFCIIADLKEKCKLFLPARFPEYGLQLFHKKHFTNHSIIAIIHNKKCIGGDDYEGPLPECPR